MRNTSVAASGWMVVAVAGGVLPLGLLASGCAKSGQTAVAPLSKSGADVGGGAGAAASAAPVAAGGQGRSASMWTAIVDGKPVPAPEIAMGDAETIKRIIREGRDHSRVMETITHLTTKIGPRLTGSTRVTMANNWARDQFAAWGLSNPRLEQWGTIPVGFDRGPSTAKVLLKDEKKNDDGTNTTTWNTAREMEFSWLSWQAGTAGPVRGKVVKAPTTDEEYAKVKESLKGAWVLLDPPPPVGQRGIRSRLGTSYEQRNEARAKVAAGEKVESIPLPQRMIFDDIAGFISTSRDERAWTGAVPKWRELSMDAIPRDVHVSVRLSDYDFINSRLTDKEPIEVEIDAKATFNAGPVPVYNTIAEIPGTQWPEQVVIISAHLDSWDGPGSQGATDNGTGSSVTMEAARILAAAGVRPKRTIRFCLWTGEEQGLLGSKGYVETHTSELAGISAVFVDDGGTNTQGGLGVPDVAVPMMAAATAPTNNLFWSSTDGKWLNVNIHGTGAKILSHGGSDHASFNAVGVPGFFWDEIGRSDYGHGWHTQFDKVDLAIPEYLKQSATNSAIVAYNLACADELLPRAPVEVQPRERSGMPAQIPPPNQPVAGTAAPAAAGK